MEMVMERKQTTKNDEWEVKYAREQIEKWPDWKKELSRQLFSPQSTPKRV